MRNAPQGTGSSSDNFPVSINRRAVYPSDLRNSHGATYPRQPSAPLVRDGLQERRACTRIHMERHEVSVPLMKILSLFLAALAAAILFSSCATGAGVSTPVGGVSAGAGVR